MIKAAEVAGFPRIPCVAHILHNSVKTALEENEAIKQLVKKCHKLATLFHASPKMAQVLHAAQVDINDPGEQVLSVVMDVATRWNSTLSMLKRLVLLRAAIDIVRVQDDTETAVKSKLKQHRLTTGEWEDVEILVKILEPVEEATKTFSSTSQGLAADVAPCMAILMEELGELGVSEIMADFRDMLKMQLEERLQLTDTVLIASALHPNYNTLWYMDDTARAESIKKIIRAEYGSLAPNLANTACQGKEVPIGESSMESTSTMQKLLKRRRFNENVDNRPPQSEDEFEGYFKHILTQGDVDPHAWWNVHKVDFPVMAKLARKYLAVPATSVASERVFSYAGNVLTDKRSRLKDDVVSDIVFCNYASKCLDRARAR